MTAVPCRSPHLLIIASLACLVTLAAAQSAENLDVTAVGRDPRWTIVGRTTAIVDIKGRRALKLDEGAGIGVVWLGGYDFADGAIDLDVLGRSQPIQGSFVGVAFHVVDASTHDAVYFRPFNYRSSDPSRHSHGVEYVSHPDWPWQRLRSEHPGKYEKAVLPDPDGDEWFHVRVVVERPTIRVFVNNQSEPCLVVDALSRRNSGSIGLWVGEGSGGYFANLRVTRDDRIRRVLQGLRPSIAIKGRPAVRWTVAERMAEYHVPGASIAVIDGGRVAWAQGFGVKQTGATDSVTATTLFQAQSISKPVAATAALILADSGRVSLDEAVNTYLKSWKLPSNAYQVHEKVTLRRILSHSAGLTVGGFAGYRTGDSIPTLRQILNGEKPANNPAIRVDTVPGSVSRYSGGGLVVMQQLLMDVTGEPFPALMKRLVLAPTGMTLSTYEQPLPENRRHEAASGHGGDGLVINGLWPIQPEMAAGGLWTTPTELAEWALAITEAWSGQSSHLLSTRMAREMLSVQHGAFGLGIYLEGAGDTFAFHHAGSNSGFRALLLMFPRAGKGAVIATNADRGDALIDEILTSIATEYQWPSRRQSERVVVNLTARQLQGLIGKYALPPGPTGAPVFFEVSRIDGKLFAELTGLGSYPRMELYAASADSFFTINDLSVAFTRDSGGRAQRVRMGQIEGHAANLPASLPSPPSTNRPRSYQRAAPAPRREG